MDSGDVLAVVTGKHVDETDERYRSDPVKMCGPGKVAGLQLSKNANGRNARLFEVCERGLNRDFVIPPLATKLITVDRAEKRKFFSERSPDPDVITVNLDIAKMANLLADGEAFRGDAAPISRNEIEHRIGKTGNLPFQSRWKPGKFVEKAGGPVA